jgi:hypothetical protein
MYHGIGQRVAFSVAFAGIARLGAATVAGSGFRRRIVDVVALALASTLNINTEMLFEITRRVYLEGVVQADPVPDDKISDIQQGQITAGTNPAS